MKNAAIILVCAHIVAAFWVIVLSPTEIGHWQARKDIAYSQTMDQDCDCTANFE
jgi:hypothetical protein